MLVLVFAVMFGVFISSTDSITVYLCFLFVFSVVYGVGVWFFFCRGGGVGVLCVAFVLLLWRSVFDGGVLCLEFLCLCCSVG